MGFFGFAGFDAAVLADGSSYIYDLNFRFNGCTPPLLLYPALAHKTGLPLAKYTAWHFKGTFLKMVESISRHSDDLSFIPLRTYDPRVHANIEAYPSASCLLFGHSQEKISKKEMVLSTLGFF